MFRIIYYLLPLLSSLLFLSSCGEDSVNHNNNEENEEPLVSEFFLEDGDETEDQDVVFASEEDYSYTEDNSYDDYSSSYSSSSSSSRRSGGGALGNPEVMAKYREYIREDDNAKAFADAMVWPIIEMTYEDEEFRTAKSKVLDSSLENGVHVIDMVVTWSNKWVSKFEVTGKLTVNDDGSNARFEILEKNIEAESLESSSGNYDMVLELEQI